MADIDIKQPAKINRNTAADGDFLWEKDFKVLYENDEKLKNAIQQASQDYTAGDGISIDPSTKTISVKTGTGIEKTEEGLSVNIEGVGGAKVELQGNTFKVSAYNAEPVINELNGNVDDLQNELDAFEEEVAEKYITSADVSTPNTQYVYTTSGWQALAGGEVQELAYWRPYFDSADNKIKWEQQPSSVLTPPSPSVSLKGPQGDKGDKGTDGINGVSPTVALSPIDDGTKTGTEIVITDKDGDHTYSAWNGINGKDGKDGTDGSNGKSVELSASTVNAHLNWRLVGDTTWQDLGYAVSGEVGPRGPQGEQGPQGIQGPKGDAPTIQATTLAPTTEHTEGGVRWTIKYPEMSVSAIGDIWNGNNGTAVVQAEGYVTGNGTSQNPVKLKTEAVDAIEAVSGKIEPPANAGSIKHWIWQSTTTSHPTTPSGWVEATDVISDVVMNWMDSYLDEWISNGIGLSADWVGEEGFQKYTFGIDTTDMTAGNQYAFTTNGWAKVDVPSTSGYLPTSGGTVSGQVVLSATTGTFDQSYLKCINNANVGHAIFGLDSGGGAVVKTVNGSNESVQVNVNAGSDNSQLIEVKTNNGNTQAGYLIPAKIEPANWSPSTDDKILHIVLES